MSNATTTKSPLRIVVGSDNAGHAYKTALKETLRKHAGVASVTDVGVDGADDDTAYPHLAVDAAKKIKNGEVCHVMSPPTQVLLKCLRPCCFHLPRGFHIQIVYRCTLFICQLFMIQPLTDIPCSCLSRPIALF